MREALRPALLGFICAALVLVIADWTILHVARAAAANFDETARSTVHSIAAPSLTLTVRVFTWFGSTFVLPTLGIILFVALRRKGMRHEAWFPIAAVAVAEALTESAKVIVRRPRPYSWFGLHASETWSFPSGHSMNSMACYLLFGASLLLLIRSKRWRTLVMAVSVVLPLLIGFTRIYLGVHWPTDVISGWIAGACVAGGLTMSSRRFTRKRVHQSQTPITRLEKPLEEHPNSGSVSPYE